MRNFAQGWHGIDLRADWDSESLLQLRIYSGEDNFVKVKLSPVNNATRTQVKAWPMNQNNLVESAWAGNTARKFNETAKEIHAALIEYLDNATRWSEPAAKKKLVIGLFVFLVVAVFILSWFVSNGILPYGIALAIFILGLVIVGVTTWLNAILSIWEKLFGK